MKPLQQFQGVSGTVVRWYMVLIAENLVRNLMIFYCEIIQCYTRLQLQTLNIQIIKKDCKQTCGALTPLGVAVLEILSLK